MSAILSVLGSSAFGSIVGSGFAWLNKREERIVLTEKNKHEQTMAELANKQAVLLVDKKIEQIGQEGKVKVAEKEAEAFVESQKSGWLASPSVWVNVMREVMRPLTTTYFLVIATYFATNVNRLVGGMTSLSVEQTFSLYVAIIEQVFFLVNLTVSWYFGARPANSVRIK